MTGPAVGLRRVARGLRRRLAAVVRAVARQRRRAWPGAERALVSTFAAASRRDVPPAPSVSVVTLAPAGVAPSWLAALAALEPAPVEILVVGPGIGRDTAPAAGGPPVRSIDAAAGLPAPRAANWGEM